MAVPGVPVMCLVAMLGTSIVHLLEQSDTMRIPRSAIWKPWALSCPMQFVAGVGKTKGIMFDLSRAPQSLAQVKRRGTCSLASRQCHG